MTTPTVPEVLRQVADAIEKREASSPHPVSESVLRRLCAEAVAGDCDAEMAAILDGPGIDTERLAALHAWSAGNTALLNTVIER